MGKQSKRERESRTVQMIEKTLYTELRNLNLILKTTESSLQDFKWNLNNMIRFAF